MARALTTGRTATCLAILLANASCMPPRPHAAVHAVGPAVAVAAPARARPAPVADPLPALLADTGVITPAAPAAAPAFEIGDATAEDAARAAECLTEAVYYEARSEPVDGQRAVAQVVLNRVRNPAFPASVCGVVHQRSSERGVCQFTFFCDGSMLGRRDEAAWDRARRIAGDALTGLVYAPAGSALFYHTSAIMPWWASHMARIAQIGAHIFYQLGEGIDQRLDFHQAYAAAEPAGAAVESDAVLALKVQRFLGVDGSTVSVHHDAETVEGIVVHRGSTPDAANDEVAGVRVHVGTPPTLADADPAPTA